VKTGVWLTVGLGLLGVSAVALWWRSSHVTVTATYKGVTYLVSNTACSALGSRQTGFCWFMKDPPWGSAGINSEGRFATADDANANAQGAIDMYLQNGTTP
jgi:hypothetical protein